MTGPAVAGMLAAIIILEEAKVFIHLKNTGSAPLLKNPKFMINGNDKFARVIHFLKKKLNTPNIFLYINSTFAPSPFASIKDLYQVLFSS